MLTAIQFHREIRAGSSLPLLVEATDGRLYVVKPRGSGDGLVASVTDWIALQLATVLGLPAVHPCVIQIPPGFDAQAQDPEVRELIARSCGPNLATLWVADARPTNDGDLERMPAHLRQQLFLLDLLLLNIDRGPQNNNVLMTASGPRFIDFASSMAIRAAACGTVLEDWRHLRQLRTNIFYRSTINPAEFIERLIKISPSQIHEITSGIPDDWLQVVQPAADREQSRQALNDRVLSLLQSSPLLNERLIAVHGLVAETEAERKERSASSKEAFMRRFGRI